MEIDAHLEVRRAMAGDGTALATLWRLHRRWVAAVLWAHKPAHIELDDLMQDVAVGLVRGIKTLDDAAAFRPWLRSIARNAARSAGRRSVPAALPAEDGEVADPKAHIALDRVAIADQAASLLRQIAALPLELREPLLMRAVQGLSQRDIAATLEIPETTVETRLVRARRQLRQRAHSAPASRNGCNRGERS